MSIERRNYTVEALGSQDRTAIGVATHAEGRSTTASGANSHAEGTSTTASASSAHAEGSTTTASGSASHAEGFQSTASGNQAHAEGTTTAAGGTASHAEGSNTVVTSGSIAAHAEGSACQAQQAYAHAEGSTTVASGIAAHSEGASTAASGDQSHAEGLSTTASGVASHAAGLSTTASGANSVATGSSSVASALNSRAQGYKATAAFVGQVAHNGLTAPGLTAIVRSQVSDFYVGGTTVGTTFQTLTSDGTGSAIRSLAGTGNLLIVPFKTIMLIRAEVIGRRTDAVAFSTWNVTCTVVRDATGSARFIASAAPTPSSNAEGTAGTGASISIDTTDATNNIVQLGVNGPSGGTMQWFGHMQVTELTTT